jgi:hypothetical protein
MRHDDSWLWYNYKHYPVILQQETEENHENPYNSFLWTKISTWDLINKMQECYSLSCDVQFQLHQNHLVIQAMFLEKLHWTNVIKLRPGDWKFLQLRNLNTRFHHNKRYLGFCKDLLAVQHFVLTYFTQQHFTTLIIHPHNWIQREL